MHPRQLLNHSFYDVLCNCRAVDQSLNPVKTTLPIKEDDDAHSIASYVLYPRTLFLLLLIYLLPVSELSILFYSHFHVYCILSEVLRQVDGGAVVLLPSGWMNVRRNGRRLLTHTFNIWLIVFDKVDWFTTIP